MDKEGIYKALLAVSLSIGRSADLHEMLGAALESFCCNLALSGAAVLFLKTDDDGSKNTDAVIAFPPHLYDGTLLDSVVSACAKSHADDISGMPFRLLGEGTAGGVRFYCYHLSCSSILILLKKDAPLDNAIINEVPHLAESLARACEMCMQRSELESVSRGTRAINSALSDSSGELLKTIDRMKQAQDGLRDSRNHLALILQSLGEGIIVTDDERNVTLINVKALEYFDFMPDTPYRITLDQLFGKASGGSEAFAYERFLGGADQPVEMTVPGHHGGTRFIRITPYRLELILSGSPETILLVQDISQDREIDRLKNEFISNLSHELRTPLNAVIGISSVLAAKNTANLDERQKEGLAIINESGRKLLSLINDILDISIIEAGKMVLHPAMFETARLIEHVTAYARAFESADVAFIADIDPHLPALMKADSGRIQQVLINLISNAFKFTAHGSVTLRAEFSRGELRFEITDTGIGIQEKDISRVFDRFHQADGSISRRYQGSGIGLSLCKNLIELMHGSIHAESADGAGTTMRVSCPAEAVNTEDDSARKQYGTEGKRKTILIAEDEMSDRETLKFFLADRYDLIFAEGGAEAVTLCGTCNPDIILMDIIMPEINGVSALNAIRKSFGTRIPVIAVTARAMKGDKEKILAAEFNGFVSKPIDENLLLEEIEKIR